MSQNGKKEVFNDGTVVWSSTDGMGLSCRAKTYNHHCEIKDILLYHTKEQVMFNIKSVIVPERFPGLSDEVLSVEENVVGQMMTYTFSFKPVLKGEFWLIWITMPLPFVFILRLKSREKLTICLTILLTIVIALERNTKKQLPDYITYILIIKLMECLAVIGLIILENIPCLEFECIEGQYEKDDEESNVGDKLFWPLLKFSITCTIVFITNIVISVY